MKCIAYRPVHSHGLSFLRLDHFISTCMFTSSPHFRTVLFMTDWKLLWNIQSCTYIYRKSQHAQLRNASFELINSTIFWSSELTLWWWELWDVNWGRGPLKAKSFWAGLHSCLLCKRKIILVIVKKTWLIYEYQVCFMNN